MNLVSAIVPVYKTEKYLNKCINSIVNQTYKNLEIILVDDGSPDNSPVMCDSWAEKDSRIKVVHKENGGLSSARNAGLNIINGDYVLFVDSDDWIEPNMIEQLLKTADKENADIAVCSFFMDFTQGKTEICKITAGSYYKNDIVYNLLLDNIRPEVCGKLYRTDLVLQNHFNENVKYAEDVLFNFDVMLNANKLVIIETPYYHYLQRPNMSITSAYLSEARAKSWRIFYDIKKRCEGNEKLTEAVIYRLTIHTFALLSRAVNVKQLRQKYFLTFSKVLTDNAGAIFKNRYVSKRQKSALLLLKLNKRVFLFAVIIFRSINSLFSYAFKCIFG